MSISQVARDFGIPCKTLADRLNGMYPTNKNGPAAPILDGEEEAALLQYIKYLAQHGFPMTRAMVRKYIVSLYKVTGRNPNFNMEIHPELSERVPETQDRCHNRMSN